MINFTYFITRLKVCLTLFLFCLVSTNLSAQILPAYCDGDPADWANFRTLYPINGYKLDLANATNNRDDQFTQGSKDEDLISAWRWSLGSANAKGDITNAAVALTGTGNCILRFAADRTSNNGDASIGFWLFRSTVSTNTNGTFSGIHTNGDILILSDFTGGGATPTISIYEWLNGALVLQSSSTARCAEVNRTTKPVPAGFTYTASNGATNYAPNLFYEGAIDLCALNISNCFASFLVETRNSQSITASLQDFALGSFNAIPPTPAASVVQPTCTVATGTVNVTGPVAGYVYTLTGTSPVRAAVTSTTGTFPNIASGTYSLTTSQGSCVSGAGSVIVDGPPANPATPAATVIQPTCTVATGTITITSPAGTGLTFSIGGAFQSSNVFNLVAPGNYTITVKNADGCTSTTPKTVNPALSTPARPVVTLQEATICGTNAQPSVTVSCPIPGTYTLKQTGEADKTFTYTGSNGPVKFNIKAGLSGFIITVTNSDGCTSGNTDCTNYLTNACPQQAVTQTDVQTIEIATPKTSVLAAPNPFTNRVRFKIESAVSGMGSLELYNTKGQKVATVYQGYVEAGKTLNKEYMVNRVTHGNLIYVFRVGDQKTTGKLLNR